MGHSFRGRFKAISCNRDSYLLEVKDEPAVYWAMKIASWVKAVFAGTPANLLKTLSSILSKDLLLPGLRRIYKN